jgi:DNA-directed RNA polymerase subunit delta
MTKLLVKQGKEECHMRELRERIAYLQGLAEGLELKQDTGEGRILGEILAIMSEMVDELEQLSEDHQELEEYVNAVDESLGELEEDYYNDEEFLEDEEDEFIEVDCPECGEKVYFEEDVLDEDGTVIEITCPNCGTIVFSTEEDDDLYLDFEDFDDDYDDEEEPLEETGDGE